MTKINAWIAAARLRTLPLSVSGIIVGATFGNEHAHGITSFSSCDNCPFVWQSAIFWLAIAVTVGFQVLSNFANDYGDGIRGIDIDRQGEKRMVASGIISPKHMKTGMFLIGIVTFILASILIFLAFGVEKLVVSLMFFILAILSILAAVKYTVGKNAYGYSGLGDIFVFLFFGLLSVLGSYYLFTHTINLHLLLPAMAIGFFSTAVLNLNNMRDAENDSLAGKYTMVVKLGSEKSKRYHALLLIIGMLSALAFTFLHYVAPSQFLYTIAFLPLLLNIKKVFENKEPGLLDGELKKVALGTFLFAILFSIFM